jgi:hypothetical protein
MPYHTDLNAVFNALGRCEREYGWALVGPEAMVLATPSEEWALPVEFVKGGKFSGERLASMLEGPAVQLIWGRLSGFAPSVAQHIQLDSIPPPEPFRELIGHPDAQIEIVAFDSTETTVFTPDEQLAERLARRFPDANHTRHFVAPARSMVSPDDIEWLARWYAEQCDGEREHDRGVRIATIDNPGWSVEIHVVGTAVEHQAFIGEELQDESCSWSEREEPPAWWQDVSTWHQIRLQDGKWQAYGSPDQLPALIARFRRWVESGK